ncbi:MAG TPA: DegT/DnrJ/EryC1/StrS family aminotransferase [Bryobacteraceae bacterium]|nr:DegT/DnrJ/EryC1/StrS family aminotransferase [Bryobacteraceae bacterium]
MGLPKWPVSGERERELLDEVLASDQWGGFHPMVGRFEREFAAFQQCRYGLSAMNGTVTLEIALEAMGIGEGDEVIVPAISFISTATSVSRVRATPVFVDIETDTFNIDPARVKEAIGPKTRAIIPVHFGGPMADMDSLTSIVAESGVPLIEDAAHAHGSEWNGRRAGGFGAISSFSFQNGKVMTAGEGGILLSGDEALINRAREIQNTGRRLGEGFFFHYTLGSNFRITALQCAVLIAQLERLPEQNCVRRRNVAAIREELADVRGLRFQRVPAAASIHTNYLLLGQVDDRGAFHRHLTAAGFPCTPFYPHTLYENPLYAERKNCRVMPCPNAEARIKDAFWIPHRALLGSAEDTQALAAAMRAAIFSSAKIG